MRATLLLAVATLVLSGCSDPAPSGGLDVTETTGGIRGVVLDEAVRPVAGALVQIVGDAEKRSTTAEDGSFAITGLLPGEHAVRATHALYLPASTVAHVEAGVRDPPAVRLLMQRVVFGEPYSYTLKETGFISCSANAGGAKSEECGEGVGVPGMGRVGKNENNRAQIDFFVDGPSVRTIIVEMQWEPSTEIGAGEEAGQFDSRVALNWTCDPSCSGNELVQESGPAPLYMRIDEKQLAGIAPRSDTVFSIFTWAEDNPGILLEQEYDVYISTFYHVPAPEGWSFVGGDRHGE